MVSTIQHRVTAPCPHGAAVDTNRSTRLRHRPRVSCDPSGWDRGSASLTLPDRRGVGDRERRGYCQRLPRLSTLRPRKPQSGEGMAMLTCAASCFPNWGLLRNPVRKGIDGKKHGKHPKTAIITLLTRRHMGKIRFSSAPYRGSNLSSARVLRYFL